MREICRRIVKNIRWKVEEKKMNIQNLHTHTNYADGKDSAEEMIIKAIEKGFQSIGFSEHSYMYYSPQYSMSLEGTELYRQEVNHLKEKYADRIEVYCGLEVDMYSEIDMSGYDYLIGSVHYLRRDNKMLGFDRSQEEVCRLIDQNFNGDGMAYAKAYYQELMKLPEYGDFDIIGHFDIIAKHIENSCFFDVNSREYRFAAIEAAEALAGKIPYFEVNTGAIARGYRTSPYPDPFIIKELGRLGFGAVVTSDCHDKQFLDCGFQNALQLLKACGFKERYILASSGFVAVEI